MSLTTQVCNPYLVANGNTEAVCVTTNGIVSPKTGRAIMGAGVAKFVRDNFPGIDTRLAKLLERYGNRVFNLGVYSYQGKTYRIISFPTKQHWRNASEPQLIQTSAEQLVSLADKFQLSKVYLPAPGCSNGGLEWCDVSPLLSCLDSRFIVTSLNDKTFNN